MKNTSERWKPCADFPNYEVSSLGRVRRRTAVRGRPPIILRPWDHRAGYPIVGLRRDGRTFRRLVHRLVGFAFFGLTANREIDHRNHDRKDVSSIRVATRADNIHNRRGQPNHSSKYKGVSRIAERGKWYACIETGGKTRSLGRFDDEAEAARAYDAAAFAAWGEFAFLNFPNQHEQQKEH
jgi:hypothetical protein